MIKKQIAGYCVPLSVAPGESIEFKVSCYQPGSYRVDPVKLICGDPEPEGGQLRDPVDELCIDARRQEHRAPGDPRPG